MTRTRSKTLLYLVIVATPLVATSPFETPASTYFDMSAFDTKITKESEKAMDNPKVKCRTVCDTKLYSQQRISDAIEFYKGSELYKK